MSSLLWEELRQPPTRRQRWVAIVKKQPSSILLCTQILVILVLPWGQEQVGGRVALTGLSILALLFAVLTIRKTPALTWISVLLMVPAMALEIYGAFDANAGSITTYAHFALAIFYLYTAYGLIAYMFEDSWVTKDELFAVGAAFTVLLFAFAYLYLGLQEIYPGSFSGASETNTFLELLYYSGANLTSCGLSDIVAVGGQARSVTIIEQLSGVLYVAMVISRLVALTAMRSQR